ncbi:exodeoxyribonuclease VII large subunit [Candidatus Saccharibacteria bacterium]|nr:exodeoxyribonuclease VII large subunit [Candidatus Saccharibacteria bacterium]
MENEQAEIRLSVSDFVGLINQTFDYAMPRIVIVGEVSGYNVRQGKWVRFKLKDEQSAVDFFGSTFQVRQPLEDGMVVAVVGRPRLSDKWGFSVSIQSVQPVGEGSIKKGFELLKTKLDAEGLFEPDRKRALPQLPMHIGVISSTQSAGYSDFIKILNGRWGGMKVETANTLVQGVNAPGQVIRALEYFNQSGEPPEVIVIVRGGGDADDLAAFNDEGLVRAIAASRIPTLVGVGHEIDITLADMVADVRAATPTNAAQILVPDRRELIERSRNLVKSLVPSFQSRINDDRREIMGLVDNAEFMISERLQAFKDEVGSTVRLLRQYDPQVVLQRGYAMVRGDVDIGALITIERSNDSIQAEVKRVSKK